MRAAIHERLGCGMPVFAFSHCRDLIAEVPCSGGFGLPGAVTFRPRQLEVVMARQALLIEHGYAGTRHRPRLWRLWRRTGHPERGILARPDLQQV